MVKRQISLIFFFNFVILVALIAEKIFKELKAEFSIISPKTQATHKLPSTLCSAPSIEMKSEFHDYTFISKKNRKKVEKIVLEYILRSQTISNEKKAIILWKIYFQELPADDFREPGLDKWKYDSLKQDEVNFGTVELTITEATKMVFQEGGEFFESKAWDRSYYKAFQLWREEFPSLNHIQVLSNAVSSAGFEIEIIRYHSNPLRFFSNGRRFMRISSQRFEIPVQSDPISARGASILDRVINANESKGVIISRPKSIPFTDDENVALLRGFNSFGEGKYMYVCILTVVSFFSSLIILVTGREVFNPKRARISSIISTSEDILRELTGELNPTPPPTQLELLFGEQLSNGHDIFENSRTGKLIEILNFIIFYILYL